MEITKIIKERAKDLRTTKTPLIAFLGDSVTQGCFELYQTREGGVDTAFHNGLGYQTKLKELFDTMFPQVSVNFLNAGISGDSAPQGAERVKTAVIDHHPQLVIVCYGLNDSCTGKEKVEDYETGLRSIFRQLKEANIDTIFMTPNMKATYVTKELQLENFENVIVHNVNNQVDGTMDCYMKRAIAVCESEQVPVCDCYRKWKKLEETGADITRLLSNRINHPTEQMHWLFAWSLFEIIMDF